MNFGFCAPIFAGEGDAHIRTPLLDRVDMGHLSNAIIEADRLGYDSLWAPDHLMLGRDSFVLEGLSFLAWVSRLTSMRLGTIHLSNVLRAPELTARMIATLDVITEGRVDLFLEAGHAGVRAESRAYGYDFGDQRDLTVRFVESIQIIKALWNHDSPPFDSTHYKLSGSIRSPEPVQRPHPPLWFAARMPHRLSPDSLDMIAVHADGCKIGPSSITDSKRLLTLIQERCVEHGRDFSSLKKLCATQILIADSESQVRRLQEMISARNSETSHYADWDALRDIYLIGDVKAVIGQIERYAELGISHFFLWFMDYPSLDGVRTFANNVIPYFKR